MLTSAAGGCYIMSDSPEAHAALEGVYPCCLCDFDILNSHASNGKVLIGGGDLVGHLDGFSEGWKL